MNIWDYAIPAATASIAGLFSFFAGKRRSGAETDSVVIVNAKEIISEWKELKAQREKDNAELENKISALEVRVEELQLQIDQERARYKALHSEYVDAMEKIDALKKRVATQEEK
jgi:peptidoglycan hydrolase CwlO-like protein